ncbi:hypothetical protein L1987_20294 [Smallanthus sonchifolius]|uniref:Uncharacterized protein n=1 Tax=Smallanthus sonchifolius TaxID=185202 RepID=A0ACB9IUB9_9ASTR|nr:hypothetical protein L1987_20294 [Smallanthus sonchifolius]
MSGLPQNENVLEKQKEKEKEKENPKEVVSVSDYHKANFSEEEEADRFRLIEEFIEMGVGKIQKEKNGCWASNYDTQKSLFEDRLKVLNATKLMPTVNVEKISKEIYSTNKGEASVKVSKETKATWFKKQPESSSRMVENFEIGLENFSKETLKEKIISWRYDGSKDLYPLRMYELAQIRTLTNEDIFAPAAVEIAYKHKDEFYARDFANLLTKVSMDMRWIEYDNSQTFVLNHQLGGRLWSQTIQAEDHKVFPAQISSSPT